MFFFRTDPQSETFGDKYFWNVLSSAFIFGFAGDQPSIIQAYDIQGTSLILQTQYECVHPLAIGIAIDPESQFLFITHEDFEQSPGNLIELVNARTMQYVDTVTALGASNLSGIVVDQSKQKVYVVDRADKYLYVYNWYPRIPMLALDEQVELPGLIDASGDQYGQGGATVMLPDLVTPGSDPLFPVGLHTLELRVTDEINNPVSVLVSVDVTDTTVPSLSPVPSVTILWPPNHKLVPITILANASDNSGGMITLAVTVQSSEPPDTDGDGNTIPDYYIDSVDNETGLIELRLRSERSGKGDGRTYTIVITATDEIGNSSVAEVQILAPHDKGKK